LRSGDETSGRIGRNGRTRFKKRTVGESGGAGGGRRALTPTHSGKNDGGLDYYFDTYAKLHMAIKDQIYPNTSITPTNLLTTMPVVQFAPFSSLVQPSFWHELTNLKIDVLRLSEDSVPISASYSQGRSIKDRETGQDIALGCNLSVGQESFSNGSQYVTIALGITQCAQISLD
jgi:hypothetical protein